MTLSLGRRLRFCSVFIGSLTCCSNMWCPSGSCYRTFVVLHKFCINTVRSVLSSQGGKIPIRWTAPEAIAYRWASVLRLVALSVIYTVMLQKLIKVIYFTGLQEVYISQRCVELWHRHVGSDVIRRAAILGDVQPGCEYCSPQHCWIVLWDKSDPVRIKNDEITPPHHFLLTLPPRSKSSSVSPS